MNTLPALMGAMALLWSVGVSAATDANAALNLKLRRIKSAATADAPAKFAEDTAVWEAQKTAIIICDMWDKHWCRGATERVAEMAPTMNQVIKNARQRGVLIIHAPSSTMAAYAGTPQRQRAQQAPKASPPSSLGGWRSLDLAKEGPLPIDDSDGGCDCEPQCPQGGPWRSQIATLEIAPEDAISDDGQEIYNLLRQSGIENVILMGVHANMCVLGRPFGIRQMVRLGFKVALMRDLTDTMYNSRMRPYVNHFRGTGLIIEHIEQHWCPSITSTVFTGQPEFHFKGESPKALIVADEFPAMELLAAKLKAEANIPCQVVAQTALPADLSVYTTLIVYIHLGLAESVETALIDYANKGGRLLVLHHSISSGKRQNKQWFKFLGVSLPNGPVEQGGYKWIEPATLQIVNLAPRQFITTNKLDWPGQISYARSDTQATEQELPGFVLANSEVYLNHVFTEPRTILLGFKYTDPKSGKTYMQDRAGWIKPTALGTVIYLMPGHSVQDFENPAYLRLLLNAVR